MRHKLKLLNLVLVVVFIFSFTACIIPKTATETIIPETTAPETTITETTAEITATETTVAETTVPETTAEETTAEETIKEITVEPIILTGSGDSIVDVDKPNIAMAAHIVGNKSSNHFAVLNYGENGNKIGLLVNTTDPYDGIRPLDFANDEWTTRFEIKANGKWTIELWGYPLDSRKHYI